MKDLRFLECLTEVHPTAKIQDLILPDVVMTECEEFIEEQHKSGLLRAKNLEPRHRVLLTGSSGNGKTLLAEAIASELLLPLFVVRYEAVLADSFEESVVRLARLFEQVRTRRCVLFFDEFDVVARDRDVVGFLLLQVDTLPSYVVVIAATTRSELLERRVKQRFQIELELPLPTRKQIEDWLRRFEDRVDEKFGVSLSALAKSLEGASFSELEQFCLDVQRRRVMTASHISKVQIVRSRLKKWNRRFGCATNGKEESVGSE